MLLAESDRLYLSFVNTTLFFLSHLSIVYCSYVIDITEKHTYTLYFTWSCCKTDHEEKNQMKCIILRSYLTQIFFVYFNMPPKKAKIAFALFMHTVFCICTWFPLSFTYSLKEMDRGRMVNQADRFCFCYITFSHARLSTKTREKPRKTFPSEELGHINFTQTQDSS